MPDKIRVIFLIVILGLKFAFLSLSSKNSCQKFFRKDRKSFTSHPLQLASEATTSCCLFKVHFNRTGTSRPCWFFKPRHSSRPDVSPTVRRNV